MTLHYGKDFAILRVVGGCIGVALIYKLYSIVSAYQPGMMNPVSLGDVLVLSISFFIVFYCLTMYWRVVLRADKVVSEYGFPLWRKQKVFTPVKSIDFKVDFIEVKNGPDQAYISVDLSVDGRDRPYPVCSLHQVRKSLFMKAHFKKKHHDECFMFKRDVNRLKALYPSIPITLDEKIVDFYEYLTSEAFPWA